MQEEKNIRNYGIDLLRILSMCGIVLLHVVDRGGIVGNLKPDQCSYYLINFIEILAVGSVNCYALISGYVGWNSRFKIRSYLFLWIKVVFYCLVITVVYNIATGNAFSFFSIIKACFPVTFDSYWYFTAYTLLFFLTPALNCIIANMSLKHTAYLSIVCFFLLSVYPTMVYKDVFYTGKGYSAMWLAYLYILGGVICKYKASVKLLRKLEKKGLLFYIFNSGLLKNSLKAQESEKEQKPTTQSVGCVHG